MSQVPSLGHSMSQIPTIGRIVIYVDYDGAEHPAVVLREGNPHLSPRTKTTWTLDDGEINLQPLGWGANYPLTKVPHHEVNPSRGLLEDDEEWLYMPHSWHWPVRQETT